MVTVITVKGSPHGGTVITVIYVSGVRRDLPKLYNEKNNDAPRDAVYIGRPSKWGNPYSMKNYWNDRMAVINMFKDYLLSNSELLEEVKKELKGKDLVCWCSPLPCHGDILLEIANKDVTQT